MSAGLEIPYDRQTLNTPNPIARYVHRKRHKIGLNLVARHAEPGSSVLDFGCGLGTFLIHLNELRTDLKLYGFDPYTQPQHTSFTHVSNLDQIAAHSIKVVTAFETLEHLFPPEIESFCEEAARIMSPDGVLIVSVPIIAGPTLLVKELNRALLFRRRTEYHSTELVAAAFLGRPAKRTENVRGSHKGFDYRLIRSTLEKRFQTTEMFYSPFGALPWFLNSQMFWMAQGGLKQ